MTKITVDKDLIEQAMRAIFPVMEYGLPGTKDTQQHALQKVYAGLTAALAEPAVEPVGYIPALEISRLRSGHDANLRSARFGPSPLDGDIAVYLSHPPAKVPMLTDEEIRSLIPDEDGWKYGVGFGEATDFARAIEAAVRNRGVQK